MGYGFHVFVFDENRITKIPYTKYLKLRDRDENERIPELAGKRMRIAVVTVETENRRPKNIIRIDGENVNIDESGKFNPLDREEKLTSINESWISTLPQPTFEKFIVINLFGHLMKLNFDR